MDAAIVAIDERPPPHGGVGGIVDLVRQRAAGAYTVDPWGLDAQVHGFAARLTGVRWSVSIGGLGHLPVEGPALLVANQRMASLAPLAAVLALGRAAGRPIRFTGVPDVEPMATMLRRVGAVIDRPDEVGGVLRDGQLALTWCAPLLRAGARVGPVDTAVVAAAVAPPVPVHAVAVHGGRWGRLLRVEVGPALHQRHQAGPLAAIELAEAARAAVQSLLDEAESHRW
jgi:hypothetical protein